MNYKEKYKEALRIAEEILRERCKEGTYGSFHRKDLEDIFPELKESEDERIRKELIDTIHHAAGNSGVHISEFLENKYIAWLEKQKPTTDIQNLTWEDIEKIGDFINMVQYENPNGIGAKCLYTDVLERFLDGKHTKQKPVEWSEEDEEMLSLIFTCIGDYYGRGLITKKQETAIKDWLKSLRPQNHWKPSDEQMKALKEAIDYSAAHGSPHWNDFIFNVLRTLYNDLKKLKEE